MTLSHTNSYYSELDYQLVLDEYYRIIHISKEVKQLFSFYSVDTPEGTYVPVSKAITEKIHWIVYKWCIGENEEILNLIGANNKVISLRVSVNEVVNKKGEIKFIINLRNTEYDSILKKRNRELKHELETFVYRTSHDLRGPLLSVLGCIQLIKIDKGTHLKEYLDRIENIVKNLDFNMKEITRQVFNRGIELQQEKLEVNQIINEIINNFKVHKNYHSVSLRINLETKYTFHSDTSLFRMIVTNLISNAFNFIDVNKATNTIELMVRVEPFRMTLNVEDNGIGIAKEAHSKVYDMFYRGSLKSQGVGLGLYMVKTAIEDLRGDISFTSNGEGTTFNLVLPNLLGQKINQSTNEIINNQIIHQN